MSFSWPFRLAIPWTTSFFHRVKKTRYKGAAPTSVTEYDSQFIPPEWHHSAIIYPRRYVSLAKSEPPADKHIDSCLPPLSGNLNMSIPVRGWPWSSEHEIMVGRKVRIFNIIIWRNWINFIFSPSLVAICYGQSLYRMYLPVGWQYDISSPATGDLLCAVWCSTGPAFIQDAPEDGKGDRLWCRIDFPFSWRAREARIFDKGTTAQPTNH